MQIFKMLFSCLACVHKINSEKNVNIIGKKDDEEIESLP